MSATKTGCKQQLTRLMRFTREGRNEDEGERAALSREVLDALLRNCQSDEHAADVVTRFIETPHYPGDVIADLVSIARSTEKHDQPPAGCDQCAIGPDISTSEMRWAAHVAGTRPDGTTYAMRCGCARGLWYRKSDSGVKPAVDLQRKPPKRLEPVDGRKLAAGDER